MKTSRTLLSVALLLAACSHRPPAERPHEAEQVVPRIARLFSACELDELISQYSPDIEFVSPATPQPLRGHGAIRAYFQGACTVASRPVMRLEEQRVKLLSPASAVITGMYSFGRSDKPQQKPWPAFFVITAVAVEGNWRIVSQATFPIPE